MQCVLFDRLFVILFLAQRSYASMDTNLYTCIQPKVDMIYGIGKYCCDY